MRIIIIFAIGAMASLFILGYTVHMFIGGLVSKTTETTVITVTIIAGAAAIIYMIQDVLRHNKKIM